MIQTKLHPLRSLVVTFGGLLMFVSPIAPLAFADEAEQMELTLTEADRNHWAFKPLSSPLPPEIESAWIRNPIDQFVLQGLRRAKLHPSTQADRRTLLRRVTFDLTGLPPTVDEIKRFLADDRPDAYERLVDRLLASKAYGERWAQHWLDLARFAETDGFELDGLRPEAWRYREWVINALNRDMPYGEFVRQQIAGDLLYPDDHDAAIATGFALCGPDMVDINLVSERRHMVLNDVTGTVGSVLLGLQLGCAECHDHMYDPVSQADFYRLRAFFEPAIHFGKNRYEDDPQPPSQEDDVPKSRFVGRVLHEVKQDKSPKSYFYHRGDFRSQGPKVEPGFPRIAVPIGQTTYPKDPSRISLADWLAAPENFLASRVIVNRVWQFHFGQGLVRSSSDFGLMGDSPSHSELLDWLAGELHREGGSLKHLHRLMVTSATYRQASYAHGLSDSESADWQRAMALDPENRLLWRANRRRLEGEAIRDAMLVASGQMSDRSGGRGVMPPLPPELVATLLRNQWTTSPDIEDHHRRSIYLFVRRNLRYPLFEVFDRPDTNASCPRRSQSTIAPQALVLLNSEFSKQQSMALASLAAREASGEIDHAIQVIYERTLGRKPAVDQLARARAFVAQRTTALQQGELAEEFHDAASELPATTGQRLAALCHLSLAAFNLNEFVYVD